MRSSVYCCFGKLFLEEYYSKKFFFFLVKFICCVVSLSMLIYSQMNGNGGVGMMVQF